MKQALLVEKGICEWLGPTGLGRLLTFAYDRLDVANLDRSGFAHVALLLTFYIAGLGLQTFFAG